MRESERATERESEKERVREFLKPKALLDEVHPLLSLAASESEKDCVQPDDVIFRDVSSFSDREVLWDTQFFFSFVHDVMMWNTNSKITKP